MPNFVAQKNYNKGEFKRKLLSFKRDRDEEYTHTSLDNPKGKFFIPDDLHESFCELYSKGLEKGESFHLTEKHNKFGPFVIDIDLRFDDIKLERKYTLEHIKEFISIYFNYIKHYINIEEEQQRHIFIMEKTKPVKDKGLIKDGLHIEIPYLSTKPAIQHFIRDKILKNERITELFTNEIKSVNSVEDIIDEAVIEKNNWFMYGSKKPEKESYNVTHVYSMNDDNCI